MNKIYYSTIGSGCLPHIARGPAHNLVPNSYPGAHSKSELRTRSGDGVVIINPEDFSVSIGINAINIIVGTVAVPLPANPLEYRRALGIHNNGDATIFIGKSNVTTSTGWPILAGEKVAFDIAGNVPNVSVYAISTTNVDVRILELA